jgi:dienelactone hydrolase
MKTLYLILTVTICISVILFVATFFYIDTHRRTTLSYNISENGIIVSNVKLDKYNTEDKAVYKSITETPLRSVTNRYKRKLSIDKKGLKVHSYNKKYFCNSVNMNVYIKPVDSSINFLAVGHSNFAYAERLPIDKDFAVFERDAIVSYFNLMDKYDFKKGGAQMIPVLTHTYAFLPPYKSVIEIRSAGEETISVNGKKMKSMRLKLKMPDRKEILMWINWWTHIPLVIKIPKDKFEVVWSDTPKEIVSRKFKIESDLYTNRDVSFKNKDTALSGTLSLPNGDGPFPAIVLIWGPGPQDRDGLGMFTQMADGFARSGIAVLRFDKRGIGKSEGNFSKFTGSDLVEDAARAVDLLTQQEEIDKEKIVVLGHSEGGSCAATLAATNPNISACIIMAGIDIVDLPDTDLEAMWSFDESAKDWDKEYINDIAKSAKDTSEILKSGKDWAILLHKRVFLKKRRLDMNRNPLETIRKIKVPLLMLGAKRDTVMPPEHIKSLEEALKESGNEEYDIVYYNKLNHFFGNMVQEGDYRTHLAIDKEIVPTISRWLEEKVISPPEPEPEPLPEPIPEPEMAESETEAAVETEAIPDKDEDASSEKIEAQPEKPETGEPKIKRVPEDIDAE